MTVLAPARHSNDTARDRGKGTFEIVAAIREASRTALPVTFILVEWGEQFRLVRDALREEERRGYVTWVPLLSRPLLQEVMKVVDLVLDQLVIPALGGVGLDALRVGATLATRSEPSLDVPFFGSPAPVLNVTSARDVVRALQLVLARDSRVPQKDEARSWFESHASWGISAERRLGAYREVLGAR